jgi:hypothetical protein
MSTISAFSWQGPTSSACCAPRPMHLVVRRRPALVAVKSDDPLLHSRGRHRCRWATSRNRCCVAHPSADMPAAGLGFCPCIVLATPLLQPHLTAPRRHLQGVEVVRLLVDPQGPVHAVSPHRDDGFIGAWGKGRDGPDCHRRGSHGSRGRGSTLLRVALMLEVADSVWRSGVLRLRGHGERQSRPDADLQDRAYEREESARKCSSADGVGSAKFLQSNEANIELPTSRTPVCLGMN